MCWPCVVRGGRGKTADAPAVLAAAGAAAAVPGKRNKKQGPRGPCFFTAGDHIWRTGAEACNMPVGTFYDKARKFENIA